MVDQAIRRYSMKTMLLIGLMKALATTQVAAAEADHSQNSKRNHGDEAGTHVSRSEDLRVLHAWTRAGEASSTRVFMEIENHGDAVVTLRGGESALGDEIDLVGFALVDGEDQYQTLQGVPIMAGQDLQLAPRGLALSIDGLNRTLEEGDRFPLALITNRGQIEVVVTVEAQDARQHGHAGHAH